MRTSGLSLFLACAAAVFAPSAMARQSDDGDARYRDQVLRCESVDGRVRECPADARGRVRLLRQLSRGPCVEGDSWGRTRGGIWVSNGCRGDFLVGYRGNGGNGAAADGFVRCESNDGRSNHCAADTRHGVELVRQLSRSACIRAQTWGSDAHGVWVSGGCRAEFRTRGGRRDDDHAATRTLRCESDEGRARHCVADTRGGVRLVRQLSRSACVEGQSWGHDQRGVWVEAGCRGEFALERGEWRGR